MAKEQVRATKIVGKAVNTFAKAVSEIDKANDLLRIGIEKDNVELNKAEAGIQSLKNKVNTINSEKTSKVLEIQNNVELADRLKQFTV